MLNAVKKLFGKKIEKDDTFVWSLAEALLWRDEEVSLAAIPSPIKEQPCARKYYDDALYLINFVQNKQKKG